MKNSFFLFCAVFCVSVFANAQGLNIGVVVPEEMYEGVDAQAYRMLSTRLEKLLTGAGASSDNNGNVVMYPVMNFVSDDMIEGGMRNIYSIDLELTVNVVSLSSNVNFGGLTWNLKGKGYSKSEAAKEAFGKIRTNDPNFTTFYNEVKKKIEKYYVSNRANMLSKAKTLAAQKQYEDAIALLYEYPSGLSGYEQVQAQIASTYKQYAKDNCSKILQQARAEYAVKHYEAAADILETLEGGTPCDGEAKTLSNQILQQINKDEAAARAYNLKKQEIGASVEKARLNAVASVASAYYNSRPRVTYNTVIVHRW